MFGSPFVSSKNKASPHSKLKNFSLSKIDATERLDIDVVGTLFLILRNTQEAFCFWESRAGILASPQSPHYPLSFKLESGIMHF